MKRIEMYYLTCECYSPEHTVRWCYDKEHKEVYSEIYLNQYRSFFKRLWVAIKYFFGYTSRYGHWDCVSMTKEEAVKLRDYLSKAIEEMEVE